MIKITNKKILQGIVCCVVPVLLAPHAGFSSEAMDAVLDEATLDKSRLWLPSSLSYLEPEFYRSASIALSAKQCVEIMRGELLTIDSDRTNPVFKFICKGTESLTVATLVDGEKFEIINTAGDTKLQQHTRHLNQYWKICQRNLHAKTDRLTGLRWPEGGKMKPSYMDDDRVDYQIDFDAQGFGGEPLKYRGYCQFKNLKNFTVEVKPRPKSITP